jgi:hypothetical protein
MPGVLRREDDADAPGGAGKVARALALQQLAKQTSKFETIN